jgi:hypothetical protein
VIRVEVYRLMWVIIFEMWVINEEKQQFNWDAEYKHELAEELSVFSKLRNLFMKKFEYSARLVKKKLEMVMFERDFVEFTKDTELLAKLQEKVLKNPDTVSISKSNNKG